MFRIGRILMLVVATGLVFSRSADAQADPARGKTALETRSFVPAAWPLSAYDDAWKYWQPPLKEKPADYDAAFRDHYGLSAAPFENGKLPMGLRKGRNILGFTGLTNDCLLCHSGSI